MQKCPGRGGAIFVSSQRPVASGEREISNRTENCDWIGVLRLVKNDPKILFAYSLGRSRMPHQFVSERDLVGVGDDTSLDAEVAIIALHFRGNAKSGIGNPFSQRGESFFPLHQEILCGC